MSTACRRCEGKGYSLVDEIAYIKRDYYSDDSRGSRKSPGVHTNPVKVRKKAKKCSYCKGRGIVFTKFDQIRLSSAYNKITLLFSIPVLIDLIFAINFIIKKNTTMIILTVVVFFCIPVLYYITYYVMDAYIVQKIVKESRLLHQEPSPEGTEGPA